MASREPKRHPDAALRAEVDKWRWESIQQPEWRADAARSEDYVDGNQLDAEALDALRDRQIPRITVNLIQPTVELILGMEARSRTDFVVRPDGSDGRWDDVALAVSERLSQAERMSHADAACAEAYADQVVAGLGWVEVSREVDPFRYPYRVRRRDWREFWYDIHSEQNDLSDAMYLIRRKFYDRSHLTSVFPNHKAQIEALGPGWNGQPQIFDGTSLFEPEMLVGNHPYRDYSRVELQYLDIDRDRLQLEEVWYRRYVRGDVALLPDGQAIEYDDKNPVQAEAANRGIIKVINAPFSRMRRSFWVGPYRIADDASPYSHNQFPYIPFWGYREGRTGVPYGIVRRMRPMQDEINARRSKMLWGLSASRVIADDDTFVNPDAARLEVARRDAWLVTNKNRLNKSSPSIDDGFAMNEQQFKVYADAKEMLQDTAGVFQSMLGKRDSGADSGVAIQSLVDQGTTTLARVNDWYAQARVMVGQQLMAMVIQDMEGPTEVTVDTARGKRKIALNIPAEVDGVPEAKNNNVMMAKLSLALDEIPSTPTARLQQFNRIVEIVRTLPPELQAPLLDMVIDASDVPNKQKFVERIREAVGISVDPEDMTPEQIQQAEAAAQQQEEEAQMLRAIQEARLRAEGAKAALDEARAQKALVEVEEIAQDMEFQDAAARGDVDVSRYTVVHRL